jgi:hypothetical protein
MILPEEEAEGVEGHVVEEALEVPQAVEIGEGIHEMLLQDLMMKQTFQVLSNRLHRV